MNVYWQASAVHVIRKIVQFLENLRVEHSDKIVEGRIIVWDHSEQRGLFLAEQANFQRIPLG